MIGLGIENPGGKPIKATTQTDLVTAFTAVTNIVFAYCTLPSRLGKIEFLVLTPTGGHVAYFGIMAELQNPRDFPKALCLLQVLDICIYIVVAIVVYYYAGDSVASPALGSTNPILQKVAYGIALPTIVIAGVIFGHVGIKYIYLRIFEGTDRMHKRDFVATGSWVGIGAAMWTIAWIIAAAVPVFSNLLGLIVRSFFARTTVMDITDQFSQSALFGSWFSCKYFRQLSSYKILTKHSRPEWLLLALHEPGPVLFLLVQDPPHSSQSLSYRHSGMHRELPPWVHVLCSMRNGS